MSVYVCTLYVLDVGRVGACPGLAYIDDDWRRGHGLIVQHKLFRSAFLALHAHTPMRADRKSVV